MIIRSVTDLPSYVESFHPHFGEILPNGNLRLRWSGREPNGQVVDGFVEVCPEYPDYAEWVEAINNKESYLQSEREKRVQRCALRRLNQLHAQIQELQTPELVRQKIASLFPEDDPESILALFQDGRAKASGPAMQLLALRLSEGSSERLRHFINVANSDQRDLMIFGLYWGETTYLSEHPDEDEAPIEVREQDLREYVQWLQEDL